MNLSEYRKTVKYIIKLLLIFIMMFVLSLGVMAATDEISTTADNAPITFTETDITGDIDFSELPVTVTRQVGDQRTIIYKGKLGGYDNGRLNFTDFSTIDILICADYNTLGEEWIYVIPDNGKLKVPSVESSSVMSALNNIDSDIECEVSLMYDNVFRENVMLFGKQLSVPITVTNSGNTEKNVACYISEYDESGRMIGAVSEKNVTVPANTSAGIVAKKTFNADTQEAKIFLWDKETGKPLTSPVTMSETEKDYFGNSFSDAQELDISHHIEGKINTSSDVDYIKIVPSESGEYTFLCMNISGITCDLYNADEVRKKLNSNNFTYELEQGKTYYIKVYGDTPGIYILSVQCEVSEEALNFNVYEFDEEINIYKKSILEISEDLLRDNAELSKQIYKEYQGVLADDAKLHELPSFLKDHPKDLENFDELVNRYFGTRYAEFQEIKQRYLNIIEGYEQDYGYNNPGDIGSSIGGKAPIFVVDENIKQDAVIVSEETEKATPSIDIVSTTANSITYSVVFPESEAKANCIYMIDFNTENGLTSYDSVYWNGEYPNYFIKNGTYTIDNLIPGGVYILAMMWSEDGGETYGGANTLYRRVQLPYNTPEAKNLYYGDYVTARLEDADKECATDNEFNVWLGRMDNVYLELKDLTGYTPYGGRKIEINSSREDLSEIKELPNGVNYWEIFNAWSGNPITFCQPHYRALMNRLSKNDWGDIAIHELSHDFDRLSWEFDAEALSFFKSYYVLTQLNGKVYRNDVETYGDEYDPWYRGDEYYTFLKNDSYVSYNDYFPYGEYSSGGMAAILVEIADEIGWEPFRKTFRHFLELESTAQVPSESADKLKLFLSLLDEYSEHDVFSSINQEDKNVIEAEFETTLEPVDIIYPGDVGVGGYEITINDRNYTIHQFTPEDSGNYCIFTSPYGESGVSNDTILEVYEGSLTGEPIAYNDDFNDSRFSKVIVSLIADTTYYIKVSHSGTGQLHADLNITKDIPAKSLSIDTPVDVKVLGGESALYSFTPQESLTYIFDVSNYNGGTKEYDTYIKLYDDVNLTKRIAQDNTKIMVNLKAGNTYYLKFSGFFMEYAKGRITVRKGQTLEFLKRNDSSFIYVNNPEFITNDDIIDSGVMNPNKIFEQNNIEGNNTYYQTHVIPNNSKYYPTEDVYVDVDFYNPNNEAVTVKVRNLAYTSLSDYGVYDETDMRVLENYISGGIELPAITIPAKSHALLFSQPYFTENNSQLKLSRAVEYDRMCLMFDFEVTGGEITVSSLAAHDRDNLVLAYGEKNILQSGQSAGFGKVLYGVRDNELDLYDKYKGIATNQSNCIEAKLEFAIDDNTPNENLKMKMRDDYYGGEIAGLKYMWMTETSPIFGGYNAPLYAMPGNLHKFTYHYEDTDRLWNFDFEHKNTKHVNLTGGADVSLNDVADITRVNDMKEDVPNEQNTAYPDAVDVNALGMGSWGVVYRYNVTIANNGTRNRQVDYVVNSTNYLIVGSKLKSESEYDFNYYPLDEGEQTPATFYLPKGETTSFEIVTLYGLSYSGLENRLVLKEIE